jgi:hypothetical protein
MYYFSWGKNDVLHVAISNDDASFATIRSFFDKIDNNRPATETDSIKYVCGFHENNIEPCIRDEFQNTALHYFAVKGCQKVLEHPSCNTVINCYGLTPLQCMIYAGYDCTQHPDYESVKIKKSKKFPPIETIFDSNEPEDYSSLLNMLFPNI